MLKNLLVILNIFVLIAALLYMPVNFKFLDPICETLQKVAQVVHDKVAQGKTVIALGGDHTISIGTISGAASAVPRPVAKSRAPKPSGGSSPW